MEQRLPNHCPVCEAPITHFSRHKSHPKETWTNEHAKYWCGSALHWADGSWSWDKKCDYATDKAIDLLAEVKRLKQQLLELHEAQKERD
jgi:hypothetical protein